MKIEFKEVGECIDLYIDGQFIKTFNAYLEAYQNQIDAEEYVKALDTLMLKLSEAEQSIRKIGTISADELELGLTE